VGRSCRWNFESLCRFGSSQVRLYPTKWKDTQGCTRRRCQICIEIPEEQLLWWSKAGEWLTFLFVCFNRLTIPAIVCVCFFAYDLFWFRMVSTSLLVLMSHGQIQRRPCS
jgi:hypothetical protein